MMPDRLARRFSGAFASFALVAVGLLAGGCGSSSSSSSATTTPALTKAQFLAQGNAICTGGNKKLAVAEKALEKEQGTEAQLKAFIDGPFASEVQRQISAIRALGAPSGEQATVTHMLDLAQTDLNKVKANPQVLESKVSPFHDFSALAHAYGLTACAEET
jgi:hypothetical protein